MRHEFRVGDGFIEVKTYGRAELGGFEGMIKGIVEHPQWAPGGSLLIDHSELDLSDFTPADNKAIVTIVEGMKARLGRARCAFVMPHDLHFGLMRMWEFLVLEHWEGITMTFRSRDAAISWLKGQKQ